MRQQILLTILFSSVFLVTLVIKILYYPKLYGQNAYYFLSTFWICGVLVVIFLTNIIWHWFAGPGPTEKKSNFIAWPNRRKTFRIIYPSFYRPTLIMDKADHWPKRNLEFQVIDISQEGICFIDDGSMGEMAHFSGRVIFRNGDQHRISGRFIRRHEDHISVHFNRSLEWSTLLAEQRRVMNFMRPVK